MAHGLVKSGEKDVAFKLTLKGAACTENDWVARITGVICMPSVGLVKVLNAAISIIIVRSILVGQNHCRLPFLRLHLFTPFVDEDTHFTSSGCGGKWAQIIASS